MENSEIKFLCPNDGQIDQEKVSFLCNRCESRKTIRVGNTYMCPECLEPDASLECRICGSKKVSIEIEDKKNLLKTTEISFKRQKVSKKRAV